MAGQHFLGAAGGPSLLLCGPRAGARLFAPLPRARREEIDAQFIRVFAGDGSPDDIDELATRYGLPRRGGDGAGRRLDVAIRSPRARTTGWWETSSGGYRLAPI